MSFTPATAEQGFVLEHIVGLAEISPEAAELADAVLEGAGHLARRAIRASVGPIFPRAKTE